MRRTVLLASMVVAGVLAPALADAQYYGYATQNVNVRAGPDRSYPLVGWVQEGAEIEIFGCIESWRWCDIQAGVYRGWAYAGFIAYPYDGGWASIRDIGPESGLPLLAFELDVYWNAWYTTWPWFAQWPWWVSRPPIYVPPWRPPPRPPVVHPRPPIGVLPPRPPVAHPRPPEVVPPIAKPPGGKPPVTRPVPPSAVPPATRPPSTWRPPSAVPPPARPPTGWQRPSPPQSSVPPSVPPMTTNPAGPTPVPLAPPSHLAPPAAVPVPAPRPHPRGAPG